MAKHIYIHIPFCEAKCPYCDFYSVTSSDDRFFDAALAEIDSFASLPAADNAYDPYDTTDTLYIGGGTPSSVNARKVASLVVRAREVLDLAPDPEATIEVNPHSITRDKALIYKDAGINRVSVGVQSLQDSVLRTLGRLHDSKGAADALTMLTSVFDNVSADLMLGIPGQTKEMLLSDADTLIGLGVKHISMYSLTLEEGTRFWDRYKDDLDDLVPDEREMYHGLRDHLASRGLVPYEISNCAYKGYESRHNMSYWQGREYYAAGPSSHGFLGGRRFSHSLSVSGYISDPLSVTTEEVLTDEDRMREYAMLMLRTSEGIPAQVFRERFGQDLGSVYEEEIRRNISEGYLISDESGIRLTHKGLDFANIVFADFM